MAHHESQTADARNGAIDIEPSAARNVPAVIGTGRTLAQLEAGISHYPEPIRTEVRWIQGFWMERSNSNFETLRHTAVKLGYDKSREYFRNLLVGDYFKTKASTWQEGGRAWTEFLAMADALRRHDRLIARTGQLPFVQTPTYHCIANFITALRAPSAVCRIGGIVAPTGGQTSESFKFYRDLNNHGAVIHVEAPYDGRVSKLRTKILVAYHLSGNKIMRHSQTELDAHVNESRTIIIDNAQNLYVRGRGTDQPGFNFVRELYDDKRPTIILKFTEEFLQDLTGAAARGYFEQFVGRMGGMDNLLRLPEHAPAADLKAIAHAFRLAPSAVDDYLYKWSRKQGRIRIVFNKLQRAQEIARLEGRERITLADLAEADQWTPPAVGEFKPEEDAA